MQASTGTRLLGAASAASLAAAIVTLPAAPTPAVRLPATASPSVALAGVDSPLSELLLSIVVINNDLFNAQDVFGDYPWQPFQGAVPQSIYTALPVISQLGYNGARYLGGSVDALTTSAYILSEAAWNLPGAVVTATRQVLDGHLAEAITTLTNAIVVPVRTAGTVALDAGKAVLGGVAANIAGALSTVPGILGGFADTAAGSVQAVFAAAAAIVKGALEALSQRDFSGAWNAVVDGLFGPVGSDGLVSSSVAGTTVAVTIGPGLGPQGYPDGYRVPSVRMWLEKSQLTVADALGANYPTAAVARAASTRPNPGAPDLPVTAAGSDTVISETPRNGGPAEKEPPVLSDDAAVSPPPVKKRSKRPSSQRRMQAADSERAAARG